jgi:YHS domain-containing protein
MRIAMCGMVALVLAFSWTATAVSADKVQKVQKAEVVPYPLDKCIVTGEKLGSMGDPVALVYEGREIEFCCNGCPEKFKADPKKYIKQLDDAIIAQQKASYPLDTCVVMGGKLGDKPVDYVYKNRLIRFCCKDCVATFNKDPKKYLKMLDDAAAAKAPAGAKAPDAKPATEAPKEEKKK